LRGAKTALNQQFGDLILLFASYQQEVGGNGAAFEIVGGVPGGAVGVGDGDEVGPADGAYLLHPDVGIGEGRVTWLALEREGL